MARHTATWTLTETFTRHILQSTNNLVDTDVKADAISAHVAAFHKYYETGLYSLGPKQLERLGIFHKNEHSQHYASAARGAGAVWGFVSYFLTNQRGNFLRPAFALCRVRTSIGERINESRTKSVMTILSRAKSENTAQASSYCRLAKSQPISLSKPECAAVQESIGVALEKLTTAI